MLASGLILSANKPAFAQLQANVDGPEASVPERQSVLQRPRADYDALGDSLGSFMIFPKAALDEAYNSNIYASETTVVGDFVTTLSPGVKVSSNWDNHSLGFTADGSYHRFASHVSENEADYTLGANGRLDILGNSSLSFLYTDTMAHEPRSSPDSVTNEKSPISYEQRTTHLVFSHETYRIGLRVEGNADRFFYHDGVSDTGTVIAETYRDRTDYLVTPRLSYEIAPGYHAFIKMPLNEHLYDTSTLRDSQGGEIDAGTAIDLGNVVTAELFAGTLRQYYRDPTYHALSGVSYGGNCLWNFSALSSFKVALTHTVQETTLTGASADLQTTIMASVEHELRSNLLVAAGVGYVQDQFHGTPRLDSNYQSNASVRYLLNRSAFIEVKGSYQTRQSNADTFDYRQDIISVTLHVQR